MTNYGHLNKLHDEAMAKIIEEIRSGSNSMEKSIRQAICNCLIKSAISFHKSIFYYNFLELGTLLEFIH